MINSPDSAQLVESLVAQSTKKRLSTIYNADICQLFIDITKRIDNNSLESLKCFIPFDEVLFEISEVDPYQLIQYVKQIVFFLSRAKMELESRIASEGSAQGSYETLVQKLEAEVRQHIRIEQQQRLHIENQQQRIDELKAEYDSLEMMFYEREQVYKNKLDEQTRIHGIKMETETSQEFPEGKHQLKYRQTMLERKTHSHSLSGEQQPKEIRNSDQGLTKSQKNLPLSLQMLFKIKNNLSSSLSKNNKKSHQKNAQSGQISKFVDRMETQPSKEKDQVQLSFRKSVSRPPSTSKNPIVRNLEQQFLESERIKLELQKLTQFQNQAKSKVDEYLSHRDKQERQSLNPLDELKKIKKSINLKDSKSDLSKSTSFDANSKNKLFHRQSIKSQIVTTKFNQSNFKKKN